ncbi:MAG: ATP synthase F1 subunit epsilon [SAR116 cluster bacterium]|nr:ATP synthase F1 subunit epsilon [SAR116 cluster bacterium]RPH08723.1 MAG: ATP synthase F1 subunit epsilon [Alphaproteobacteria bacterium TMED54]|tara:strand:+ start:153 stop:560 length:408 start_codon:yes stop_codon:yes gene_type:complete
MSDLIKINIVTPLELLKSKETKMSVLPGSEGDLGVMSRHTPLMTLLNRGVIKLFDENNSLSDKIAVDGGVADISEEGITVLSERAEIIGSNSSNKQILEEKINDLNLKLKKPEIAEDKTLKDELEFLNFVLEKSN